MENMENNPKNWFVRILIILFCLGIASMIFFNFFCGVGGGWLLGAVGVFLKKIYFLFTKYYKSKKSIK